MSWEILDPNPLEWIHFLRIKTAVPHKAPWFTHLRPPPTFISLSTTPPFCTVLTFYLLYNLLTIFCSLFLKSK